jgi:hypothetical protein
MIFKGKEGDKPVTFALFPEVLSIGGDAKLAEFAGPCLVGSAAKFEDGIGAGGSQLQNDVGPTEAGYWDLTNYKLCLSCRCPGSN